MKYDFPRWVGDPYQSPVYSKEEFNRFCNERDGKYPLYTTHNALLRQDTILHRYLPWDCDADEKKDFKLDDTLSDTLRWEEWCIKHDLIPLVVFTGGRGFHNYCVFKPQKVKSNDMLKQYYVGFQMKAIREARMRTADQRIVGDQRRILRIINARYVDKHGVANGLHTVELPPDVLHAGGMDKIIEYAKERRPHMNVEPKETFMEAVNRLGIKPEMKGAVVDSTVGFSSYRGHTPELVKALMPRPCIHSGIYSQNPAHLVRLEAASTLIKLGYPLTYVQKFIWQIAEDAKWIDRKRDVTDFQTYHAYRKGGYNFHSCQKIRGEGLCIGKECPLFAKIWPAEAASNEDAPKWADLGAMNDTRPSFLKTWLDKEEL